MATLMASEQDKVQAREAMRARLTSKAKNAPLVAKAAAVLGLLGVGFGGYEIYEHTAGASLTPAQARATLGSGKSVKVSFKIVAVGGDKGGRRTFLNSWQWTPGTPQPDDAITVVITNAAVPGFGPTERDKLVGHTLTVNGVVSSYESKRFLGTKTIELLVNDPSQIRVQ